jgi:hypothetical protein
MEAVKILGIVVAVYVALWSLVSWHDATRHDRTFSQCFWSTDNFCTSIMGR